MKIAIFDYSITPTSPIGSCHLRMLAELGREHEFTVFAVQFQNPWPDRIQWVRIPAPTRPLALLFLVYYVVSPLYYWAYRLRTGVQFDLIQTVENYSILGHAAYSHFCHTVYLREHWRNSGAKGVRGWVRWLDHRLRSLAEPWTYRKAKAVVVPSHGFARELVAEYPEITTRIHVLANPVDLNYSQPPADLDREAVRTAAGFTASDVVLVFVALGHFERKGLPLLLEALTRQDDRRLKVLVVGGTADLVAAYRARARDLGLADYIRFAGMQSDIRKYYWLADGFVLPSSYEIFSLAAMQAAAAGLPVLTSRLHGVEEFLRDGENGILLERTPGGVATGLRRFLGMSAEQRVRMGAQARRDVARFSVERFGQGWRDLYRSPSFQALASKRLAATLEATP